MFGYEFYVDPSRCIGCRSCLQACEECDTHRGKSMINFDFVDRNGYIELLDSFEGMEDVLCFATDYPHWDTDTAEHVAGPRPGPGQLVDRHRLWHLVELHRAVDAAAPLRLAQELDWQAAYVRDRLSEPGIVLR